MILNIDIEGIKIGFYLCKNCMMLSFYTEQLDTLCLVNNGVTQI